MVAIAITSTMDAIGLTEFSALPLFPLMLLFWRIQRLSGWSLGFTWGRWRDHGLALLYPVLVIGSVTYELRRRRDYVPAEGVGLSRLKRRSALHEYKTNGSGATARSAAVARSVAGLCP
jgi:hypothetical protein